MRKSKLNENLKYKIKIFLMFLFGVFVFLFTNREEHITNHTDLNTVAIESSIENYLKLCGTENTYEIIEYPEHASYSIFDGAPNFGIKINFPATPDVIGKFNFEIYDRYTDSEDYSIVRYSEKTKGDEFITKGCPLVDQ